MVLLALKVWGFLNFFLHSELVVKNSNGYADLQHRYSLQQIHNARVVKSQARSSSWARRCY